MRPSRFLVIAALSLPAPGLAGIVGVAGGTGPPPPTLGPYTMTPFADDPQQTKAYVSSVASPLGGTVAFSEPLWHVRVDEGWYSWWGHGYTGDVYLGYIAPEHLSFTLFLPEDTKAFYLYSSHMLGLPHYITIAADDGTSVKQVVAEHSSAYFGFYVDDPAAPNLKSVTVTIDGSTQMAVGEFGIGIPEPGALVMLSAGALLLGSRRR